MSTMENVHWDLEYQINHDSNVLTIPVDASCIIIVVVQMPSGIQVCNATVVTINSTLYALVSNL